MIWAPIYGNIGDGLLSLLLGLSRFTNLAKKTMWCTERHDFLQESGKLKAM